MKLAPRQVVGLIALVVFGGILAWIFLEPKPDPYIVPGALPSGDTESGAPSVILQYTKSTAAVSGDPLTLGPDDAKDDLYCSGLIYAAHQASGDVLSDGANARRTQVIRLAESGVGKLIAADAATGDQTGAIADAHTEKAKRDFAAGTPRIALDACKTRAEALPAK